MSNNTINNSNTANNKSNSTNNNSNNKNKCNRASWDMILYEIRNITGNPFIHIFGLGFPIILSILISKTSVMDLTDTSIIQLVSTSVFLGIGFIIPMATILMGYAATYSQEIEKGVSIRMKLFGFDEKYILLNRMIAEFIFLTFAFILYSISGILFIKIKVPTVSGVVIYLFSVYAYSVIMFMLAHSIAGLLKKFGITYAITMGLYFFVMIFGGLMGISYDRMPAAMQTIANLLPVTYITQDAVTFWQGKTYNFVPMIQSFVFLAAVSGILLFISTYRSRRNIH